ncbi:unnamed protein product [Cunninghamella blakesleeana]
MYQENMNECIYLMNPHEQVLPIKQEIIDPCKLYSLTHSTMMRNEHPLPSTTTTMHTEMKTTSSHDYHYYYYGQEDQGPGLLIDDSSNVSSPESQYYQPSLSPFSPSSSTEMISSPSNATITSSIYYSHSMNDDTFSTTTTTTNNNNSNNNNNNNDWMDVPSPQLDSSFLLHSYMEQRKSFDDRMLSSYHRDTSSMYNNQNYHYRIEDEICNNYHCPCSSPLISSHSSYSLSSLSTHLNDSIMNPSNDYHYQQQQQQTLLITPISNHYQVKQRHQSLPNLSKLPVNNTNTNNNHHFHLQHHHNNNMNNNNNNKNNYSNNNTNNNNNNNTNKNKKASNKINPNIKPYQCPTCQRCFARKHDLQRHIRVHTGDKPYSCPCCKKPFARTDALKRHLRMEADCRNSPQVRESIATTSHGKQQQKNNHRLMKNDQHYPYPLHQQQLIH